MSGGIPAEHVVFTPGDEHLGTQFLDTAESKIRIGLQGIVWRGSVTEGMNDESLLSLSSGKAI
jgi:hypothetical protein